MQVSLLTLAIIAIAFLLFWLGHHRGKRTGSRLGYRADRWKHSRRRRG